MEHQLCWALKTLPVPLRKVLEQISQIVNFVRGGALNSQLFKQLCIDVDAGHHLLHFHTNIRGGQEEI